MISFEVSFLLPVALVYLKIKIKTTAFCIKKKQNKKNKSVFKNPAMCACSQPDPNHPVLYQKRRFDWGVGLLMLSLLSVLQVKLGK